MISKIRFLLLVCGTIGVMSCLGPSTPGGVYTTTPVPANGPSALFNPNNSSSGSNSGSDSEDHNLGLSEPTDFAGENDSNDDGTYNLASALQKALFFYDTERSGDLPDDFRVSWRGDSQMCDYEIPLDSDHTNLSTSFISDYESVLDPDGDGTINLGGGFHDAGDHVKFGLPQTYTASTLGWAFYEFRDAFDETGQSYYMADILKWFSDYFLRSTFTDASGNVIAFGYQVGEGSIDHNYWGPPELQSCEDFPRPAYLATEDNPASDQVAGAAAALALSALNFEDYNAEYADLCLTTAIKLYEFAKNNRGLGYSGGFYGSSDDNDEMAWAAIWLYEATGDSSYLDDIISQSGSVNTGYLSAVISSDADTWENIWTHCWDTVWTGVILKLGDITNDSFYKTIAQSNLDYWEGDALDTDAGYAFLTIWGSARYNTASGFMGLLYRKYFGETKYADWAFEQMNYLMGDNPNALSYIVGFGDNSVRFPHHRAAHASFSNSMDDPYEHAHVLYGALVGGPDDADQHIDETSNYIYNEVAIDYNAGFVGALAGLYEYYNTEGEALAGFPAEEQDNNPIVVQAKIEQETDQRTQVSLKIVNQALFPPRTFSGITVRYYFSITELKSQGQSISDVSTAIYYDEGDSVYGEPASVSGPFAYSGDVYYIEVDWSDYELMGEREIQVALITDLASDYSYHWDPSNDPSHEGLNSTDYTESTHIPIFQDGSLIFGAAP